VRCGWSKEQKKGEVEGTITASSSSEISMSVCTWAVSAQAEYRSCDSYYA
jgi:hypothetical protein